MITQQTSLAFSDHLALYDLIIPKTNLLCRINDLIDFSFVHDELFSKYCHNNGRTTHSPIRMFKYLLLKAIYDLSDIDVVERSMYDMSFKYFLTMFPEDGVIEASSLYEFRKIRLKDMNSLSLLINKVVTLAIEKGIIKSTSIIVDTTHYGSRSNPISPIEVLQLRLKQLRKSLYDADETIKDSLPKKNEDSNLEHELDYTQSLLECLCEKEVLKNIPKVKEKLNLLKATISDI